MPLPVLARPALRAVYVSYRKPWSTPPVMSGVRPHGMPSPSNGALSSPSGSVPSSTSSRSSPATRSPSRPANSERFFCTASAVSALLSTPKNAAETNGSRMTGAFIDGHFCAPSRRVALPAASAPTKDASRSSTARPTA